MKTLSGKGHNREWYRVLLVMLFSVAGLVTPVAKAQEATANVNGVVKDPTGAAIANAEVELANVNTGFVRTTSTNSDGAYDFPSIVPGVYTMRASAAGFSSVTQPAVTLQVSQTATFDFQLSVGKAQENVTVNASEGAALETSTSELGTVVSTQEVSDLPLNGRNFTQLLTITAGVANINRDQNSNGGGNWAGNSLGSFSYPAVNGARNRSNFFVLDGANDLDTMESKYNFAPIVDAIQEFKTQGHNDLAEYGGAAGGIVSVVTKSGTNEFHGTLWEFLRNQVMDATGYFNASKPPLRQNQYGASVGGPISIPKLYNGKNRTFFFAAWEGYRFRSASETGVLGPTDAERGGDFSALSAPIYDPTTTTFNGTSYTRETFTQEYNEGPSNTSLCNGHTNCIPASRINPISALYQSLIPHAGPLVNGSNIYSSGPQQTNQDSGTLRADQNFGNNDQLMFRYSQFNQQVADATDIIGQVATHVLGHNYIGHWTHTFSPTAFSDVYFGRNYGDATTGTAFPGENAAFIGQLQTLGMSTAWMTLNNTLYAPQWSPDGYIGLTGSQLQETGLADDWQYGGSFTKILGRNTIKAGADFQTNNFRSPIAYSQAEFGPSQTAGLGGANQGVGGDSWASMLVGVPYLGNYRNILEKNRGGWIDGVFVQDQFKASSHLTVNLGFRDDMVWTPIYGTGLGGNFYTGNANPVTGLYELNALPPTCSATQGAPCIPNGVYTASSTPGTGQLPPSAYVDSSPVHRVIKNSFGDWAGRLGLDYRLNNKTVIRGSYSRFYDAWATVVQLSQNFGGNWPAVNTIDNSTLNNNIPTAFANDPLGLGSGGALVYPINDFSQVSQWMVDPNFRTPYMDQWNVGVQRELPDNTVLDANYVGSVGRHLDWGPAMNVPQPGPGNIQARRPYPYMLQQWFDQSVGDSRYNALQVTVNKRTGHGVTFLVAYTLSHSDDDGCGLGYAVCHSTNPYNRKGDYGTSDLNQANAFSAAFVLQSPFNHSANKMVATLAGGWGLNGIGQIGSGQPYTIRTGSDPENVGYPSYLNEERVNQVGNPNSGSGLHTAAQWFNVNAFQLQGPYTYGDEKRNPLVSDGFRNLDLSLFRTFHLGLGEERYFEFRAESFNLFNRTMFDIPQNTIPATNFGEVTDQYNSPRQLQMSLKFYY